MAGLAGLVPGLAVALLGFVLLAIVQMGRAAVDTAEYTQQMLKIARDQLEVSQQGLRSQHQPPQTFTAAGQNEASSGKASFSQPGLEPKLSAKPKPDPSRFVEYKGKEIVIENGKYNCNGIPFTTMQKAEHYIDTYAAKELPGAYEKPNSQAELNRPGFIGDL